MSNQQRPRGRSRGQAPSQNRPNTAAPSNEPRPAASAAAAAPPSGATPKESTNLRDIVGDGRTPRPGGGRLISDIVPIEVIIAIFVGINVLVFSLSYGKFARDFDVFLTRYYQRTQQWDKATKKILSNMAEYKDMEKSPTPLGELGNAYFNKGDFSNAMKYFLLAQQYRLNIPEGEEGRSFQPTEFSPVLAMCAFRMGNKADAEKYARGVIQTNRTDPYANYVLGELEYAAGNLRSSVQHYKVIANNAMFKDEVEKRYESIESQLFKSVQ